MYIEQIFQQHKTLGPWSLGPQVLGSSGSWVLDPVFIVSLCVQSEVRIQRFAVYGISFLISMLFISMPILQVGSKH